MNKDNIGLAITLCLVAVTGLLLGVHGCNNLARHRAAIEASHGGTVEVIHFDEWTTNSDGVTKAQTWEYRSPHPMVGDIYAEYMDNRTNQVALNRGFDAEVLIVHKVVGISNGTVFCVMLNLQITNQTEYPWPFNEISPLSSFSDHGTRVKEIHEK